MPVSLKQPNECSRENFGSSIPKDSIEKSNKNYFNSKRLSHSFNVKGTWAKGNVKGLGFLVAAATETF